jgi:hypothetical protein
MRNRVLEVRNIPAKQLCANPRNWRLHPDEQRSALGAMMDEIGFVGTLIARDTPDGIELIDGHLRADLTDDAEVPVAIVDLDDDEAARVLATYDPLGGMALVDNDQLAQLLGEVDTDENAEFRRIIADLHRKLLKEEVEGKDEDAKREVPGMDLQPHEHYDYLVVLATTTQEWNVLCDRLGLKPAKRRGRVGTARAIRASQLLTVMSNAGLHDSGAVAEAGPQHADHPEPAADSDRVRRRRGKG